MAVVALTRAKQRAARRANGGRGVCGITQTCQCGWSAIFFQSVWHWSWGWLFRTHLNSIGSRGCRQWWPYQQRHISFGHTLHRRAPIQQPTEESKIQDLQTQIANLKGEISAYKQADTDHVQRIQGIRENLGKLLLEGQQIQRCADESKPAPEQEANSWAEKTEQYLTPTWVIRTLLGSEALLVYR
jgi:hypothetical protein